MVTTKSEVSILTPRQGAFIRAYSNPTSPTFGNCYKSAINSGYSDLTARNLTHLKPQWLLDSIGQIASIEPEQLKEVLTGIIYNDAEPTIIKLKAVELMMRYFGMLKPDKPSSTSISVSIDLTGGSKVPLTD